MSSDLDIVPLRPLDLDVGGQRVRLFAAQDHDALLAATSGAGHLPFGLVLWESAVALTEALIARRDMIAGRTLLELGAGLGLPGIVAAQLGAEVTQTDCDPLALKVCARNAQLNGLATRMSCRIADWRTWTDTTRYDHVIGADILYDRDEHVPIARTLTATLAPGGLVLLTDPMRPDTPKFVDQLRADQWTVETVTREVADLTRPDKRVAVSLIEARRV